MAASNVCWGIEVGAGGIKALKCRLDGDRVVALDYVNIEHPKVLSTPGIDVNDVLRVSLGTLTSQYDLSKATIAISVPGHSSFARFAKLPPVEPKKVPDIVKFEAVQQIPFPLEQVEWDFQTFQRPDSPDVEVGIFAITRERVMERLNMLTDVNITPDIVTLSPVAAYNAIAYDLQFVESTPGTIILDIGTTSTDLVVAEAGCVWVRTFPLGGHQFTEALVNQFKLSYPKADKIKRDVHDSKHARQVFQAMRPVFTDLTQDVQRSIGYYQSLHREAQLQRVIGVGSTFNLPGLRKYLKQQLSLDVYRLEEFKRLDLSELGEERSAALKKDILSMATAYGLALQGLGLTPIRANLMPTSVVREAMWKSKRPLFAAAAIAAVVGGGAMFLKPYAMSDAVKSINPDPVIMQTVSLATELKRKATEAGVVGSAEQDNKAANVLSLVERRDTYALVVRDLAEMMADADQKAASWSGRARPGVTPPKPIGAPGFSVEQFDTRYAGPGAGGTPGAPPPPPGAEGANMGRISVTMRLSTYQPDPQEFILQSIRAWLSANKERAGVPYRIEFKEPLYTAQLGSSASTEVAEAPSGDSGSGPAAAALSPTGEDPRAAAERGEGRSDGRRALRANQPADDGPSDEERRLIEANSTLVDRSSRGPGGSGELSSLAPLSLLRAPGEERKGQPSVFTVKYDLVILPPAKDAKKEGGK
jgi:type IV pilus assembly protein PilM